MNRLAFRSPGFVTPPRWPLALVSIFTLLAQTPAQEKDIPLAQGTHLFRSILHDLGLQPLGDNPEKLALQPTSKLLIVLGDTKVLAQLPGLEQFIKQGGAALIATDQEASPDALKRFGITFSGDPVSIDPKSPAAYRHCEDYVIVQPLGEKGPVLRGLSKVSTNRPGYLRTDETLPVLAVFPEDCLVNGKPSEVKALPFAAGGKWGKGRILFLSDHSVFINAMLWQLDQGQEDNDNWAFAVNCVEWLCNQNKRTQALFYNEQGEIETQFDIPRKPLPPPPLPPLETILAKMDAGLQGLEEDNHFNEVVAQALAQMDQERLPRRLLLGLTLTLALIGLYRLVQARHRFEPGAPRLASGLAQLVPSVSVADQRRRAMLRDDNFWELARELARQTFAPAGTGNRPPFSGSGAAPALPAIRVEGNRWRRWTLTRQVRRLWGLASRSEPVSISARQWRTLVAELATVRAALADGSLRLGEDTAPKKRLGSRPVPLHG